MVEHTYEIREATWRDAVELAPKLRQADLDEIKAASGRDALGALSYSLKNSRSPQAGLIDGEVVCMFGVAQQSFFSIAGAPWLLASDQLVKHAKPFLRRSREYIKSLKKDYLYLCNYVDARNTQAIKWLRWLGFDILPTQTYGVEDLMFHPFEMKRKAKHV